MNTYRRFSLCISVAMIICGVCQLQAFGGVIAYYSFDSGTYNAIAQTVDDIAGGDVGNNQAQAIGANVVLGVPSLPSLGQAAKFVAPFTAGGNDVFIKLLNAQLFGPGRDELSGMAALTVSAWVRPETNGFMWSFGGARDIIRLDENAFGHPIYGLQVGPVVDNTNRFHLATWVGLLGDSQMYRTLDWEMEASSFFDGQWHLVAEVYDGSSLRLYLDGQEAPISVACTGSVKSATSSYALDIGNFANAEAWEPWHGLIDEVRIYNAALSAEALAEQYRRVIAPGFASAACSGNINSMSITNLVPPGVYAIQRNTNGLSSSNWITVEEFEATDVSMSWSETGGWPVVFYRVKTTR